MCFPDCGVIFVNSNHVYCLNDITDFEEDHGNALCEGRWSYSGFTASKDSIFKIAICHLEEFSSSYFLLYLYIAYVLCMKLENKKLISTEIQA